LSRCSVYYISCRILKPAHAFVARSPVAYTFAFACLVEILQSCDGYDYRRMVMADGRYDSRISLYCPRSMNAATFDTDMSSRGTVVGSESDKKSGVGDSRNAVPLSVHLTSTTTLSMSQPNWNRPPHPSKHAQRVDEPPASQHRAYPGPAGVGLIDEQLGNIRSQFEHILQQNHLLKAANDDLETKRACDIAQ